MWHPFESLDRLSLIINRLKCSLDSFHFPPIYIYHLPSYFHNIFDIHMSLFICDRLMVWRQSIFISISISNLCSIPIPVSSSSSASPKGNCPLIYVYGRLIESALRKHDFHVISIQIVWLTAKSIFTLPPAAGSPISILDWSLFISIGSLPVAPECCCSKIGKSWATNDVSSRSVCTVSTIENNLQSAGSNNCNCWCWHILCDAHRFAE